MFCERITFLFAVTESWLLHALRRYIYVGNVVYLLVLVLLLAAAVFNLLVHIDVEFDVRLSIEVNSRQALFRHLPVFDLDELQ